MKNRILTLAVLMGLSIGLMAQTDTKKEVKAMKSAKHEMRMRGPQEQPNFLNLTDEQKEAFKQSRLTLEKQLLPIRNELGEAEAHQRTLTTSEKPDLDAINKNIEKIGKLKTDMAKIQARHRLEMRAQLTDEQRLKMDNARHMRGDFRGGREMRHQGRFSM